MATGQAGENRKHRLRPHVTFVTEGQGGRCDREKSRSVTQELFLARHGGSHAFCRDGSRTLRGVSTEKGAERAQSRGRGACSLRAEGEAGVGWAKGTVFTAEGTAREGPEVRSKMLANITGSQREVGHGVGGTWGGVRQSQPTGDRVGPGVTPCILS